MPAQLADRPDDPDVLLYLWEWYWEMRPQDRDGMTGAPHALGTRDIFYWQEVTGMKLTGRERDLLKRLDRTYLTILSEAQERSRARAEKKRGH